MPYFPIHSTDENGEKITEYLFEVPKANHFLYEPETDTLYKYTGDVTVMDATGEFKYECISVHRVVTKQNKNNTEDFTIEELMKLQDYPIQIHDRFIYGGGVVRVEDILYINKASKQLKRGLYVLCKQLATRAMLKIPREKFLRDAEGFS